MVEGGMGWGGAGRVVVRLGWGGMEVGWEGDVGWDGMRVGWVRVDGSVGCR